jgi:hypothetical protein
VHSRISALLCANQTGKSEAAQIERALPVFAAVKYSLCEPVMRFHASAVIKLFRRTPQRATAERLSEIIRQRDLCNNLTRLFVSSIG